MKGRLENKLKIESFIEKKLVDSPSIVREWYNNLAVSKEPLTCKGYVTNLLRVLDFLECKTNQDVYNISSSDLEKYFKSIEIVKTADGEVKEASFSLKKKTWSLMNSFFKYLVRKHYITDNPVLAIDYPKNKDEVKRLHLTEKDLHKILLSVENGAGTLHSIHKAEKWINRDLLIFKMMICTGMRESALLQINLEDIDFENNTITVTEKRHKTREYLINEKLRTQLDDWLSDREVLLDGQEQDALFISNKRTRLSAKQLEKITKRFSYDAIGLKLSPHKFRAAFGTIMYKKTKDITFVQEAMGHDSIATTKLYIVDNGKTKEKIASITNDLI